MVALLLLAVLASGCAWPPAQLHFLALHTPNHGRYAYTGYRPYGLFQQRQMERIRSQPASPPEAAGGAPAEGGSGGGDAATAGGTVAAEAADAASGAPLSLPAPETSYNVFEEDGMETIYAWLYSRIPHTRGPGGAQLEAQAQAQAQQQVEPEPLAQPVDKKHKTKRKAKSGRQKQEGAAAEGAAGAAAGAAAADSGS